MSRWTKVWIGLFSFCFLVMPAWSQQRPITTKDYYSFKSVGDPQLSPDGKMITYTVGTIDQKQNKRHSEIWLAYADGSHDPRPLTDNSQSSSSPRWSPDGKSIAFLSARPSLEDGKVGKRQVQILSFDGGESRPLTNLKNGVGSFVWSPDGTRLVCVSTWGLSDTVPENADKSDTRHYIHPTYKFDGKGFFDDHRSHLWVVDVKSGGAKQITEGDDWDDADPAWSPDGTRIAFASDRSGKFWDDVSYESSALWAVPAEGGTPVRLSAEEGISGMPQWSSDGKWIAYLGSKPGFHNPPKLMMVSSEGGAKPKELAHDLDLSVKDLEWGDDGRGLYFLSGVRGQTHLFRADAASGKLSQVTSGERFINTVSINDPTRAMAYTASDFKHPGDLYVAKMDGTQERQITHVNQALLSKLEIQPVERMTYKAADGLPIDGFLVKPVGWQEGKKYPMILWIHGGPEGMFGTTWSMTVQNFAAHGWGVFFTNPRASTGYGTKFMEGAELEWGGKIYTDIMTGVDTVVKQNSWIDADKLGVSGCSFGGYMTNWIVSQTTRFKAAVPMCSISNLISDEGTRDDYYGHAGDFGGDLYQNFDLYWKYSPVRYAMNVKTPVLILHGESDQRVPLEQPEQWFRALHHFNVTSEFVIFPHEFHGELFNGEPRHVVEAMNWQAYWFNRFLDGNTAAVPPDAIKEKTKSEDKAKTSEGDTL